MPTKDRITDLQSLLAPARLAHTARDYAREIVSALARDFDSPVCVWLNYTSGKFEPVAWTADAEPHLAEILRRSTTEPSVENEILPGAALRSIVCAPMLFRSWPGGVLVLAGHPEGYTQADCEPLMELGRSALVAYENRRLAGDAGCACTAWERALAQFVHRLRQPLSIIDTCAYFMGMILPESPEKSRSQISVIQEQVAIADRILNETAETFRRPGR